MVKKKLSSKVEIYLDKMLMFQLDTLVYNVKEDWDFMIIITGDRMVRIGKSVLGMQIGAYLAYRLKTSFSLHNINFNSDNMIEFAQKAKPNSIVIYDEGREGLAATKTAKKIQQDLLDYFAECGQLNHIFIIILPDFFDLKENIAVGRSEFLINCWRTEEKQLRDIYKEGEKIPIVKFKRGFFEFFSRKAKSALYDKFRNTRRKDYQMSPSNLKGRFVEYYPVNEQAYRKKKIEELARFTQKKKEEKAKGDIFRDKIISDLHKKGLNHTQIAKELEEKWEYSISSRHVSRLINDFQKKNSVST